MLRRNNYIARLFAFLSCETSVVEFSELTLLSRRTNDFGFGLCPPMSGSQL